MPTFEFKKDVDLHYIKYEATYVEQILEKMDEYIAYIVSGIGFLNDTNYSGNNFMHKEVCEKMRLFIDFCIQALMEVEKRYSNRRDAAIGRVASIILNLNGISKTDLDKILEGMEQKNKELILSGINSKEQVENKQEEGLGEQSEEPTNNLPGNDDLKQRMDGYIKEIELGTIILNDPRYSKNSFIHVVVIKKMISFIELCIESAIEIYGEKEDNVSEKIAIIVIMLNGISKADLNKLLRGMNKQTKEIILSGIKPQGQDGGQQGDDSEGSGDGLSRYDADEKSF